MLAIARDATTLTSAVLMMIELCVTGCGFEPANDRQSAIYQQLQQPTGR